MDEIREAAIAYYENGDEEQKQLARDFFNILDVDGDGTVDAQEFITILRGAGCQLVDNPSFFRALDSDGNGTLDFCEFLSFYYIIKSGRPFCDGCGSFLKGLFFTCPHCHRNSNTTFDLCSACYRGKRFSHQHATFLDNYTLLATTRLALLECKAGSAAAMGKPDTSQATSSRTGCTTLQQRTSKTEKANQAIRALDAAVSIGTNAVQIASVCAIM